MTTNSNRQQTDTSNDQAGTDRAKGWGGTRPTPEKRTERHSADDSVRVSNYWGSKEWTVSGTAAERFDYSADFLAGVGPVRLWPGDDLTIIVPPDGPPVDPWKVREHMIAAGFDDVTIQSRYTKVER